MAQSLEALARRHARELAQMGITAERAIQIAATNVKEYPAAIQRAYLKTWRATYQTARKRKKA